MIPLPPISGPKLEPFNNGRPPAIKFLRRLGFGIDGYVWKVCIDGKIYALKIFPPEPEEILSQSGFQGDEELIEDTMRYYEKPLWCECKAYGRLKEVGKEHLAVKCHGYIQLTSNQVAGLGERSLQRPKRDGKFQWLPLIALVKDFIDSKITFTGRMVPGMIEDLFSTLQVGIFNGDIREENYLNGVMVDFGNARTVPHPRLTVEYIASREGFCGYDPKEDEIAFDQMIDDYNEGAAWHKRPLIWKRIAPNWEYKYKLRRTREDIYPESKYAKFRPSYTIGRQQRKKEK
ncbi:kinetochore Sim4 complex subunit FTA2-domain-containing protein [Whalleya microplaca]|nr:kinetochore Sim4 complex subunit FTA2-domain-containing protein [Whalleya microplaca]